MMLRGSALVLVLSLVAQPAGAAPVAYTDQASFLSALAGISDTIAHEGFESDAAWGDVRSTVVGGFATAAAVSNLGVTWSSNNLSSEITTGNGAALEGNWGFYSYPHGSYTSPDPGTTCDIPGDCGDGFQIAATNGVLFGIGGWIRTNTPLAKVGLYIGAYNGDVEGGVLDQTVGTQAVFLGVIDAQGFTQVEFRELEGKTEGPFDGDLKNIFADDFYFAGTNIFLPEPGDFNLNGVLDTDDVDALVAEMAVGGNDLHFDLNSDTFVDLDDLTIWVKDLKYTWFGDVNLDGEFNPDDLIEIAAANTYERDVTAVWTSGDFNGNGRFDPSDLIDAAADNGYEAGPRPAAVPEPSSVLLLALGLAWRRRRGRS